MTKNIVVSPEDFPSAFSLHLRYPGRGLTMRGWDISPEKMAAALAAGYMLRAEGQLMTNQCPWSCSFCFSETPKNPSGAKRSLPGEMTLSQKLRVISEMQAVGVLSIDFVGAGEPTLDPNFWRIIEETAVRGIIPIVYSEASFRLTDRAFVDRLYQTGATVVVKTNSVRNAAFQNGVVAGALSGKAILGRAARYAADRDRAVGLLLERGFASTSEPATRLAFDTIVCRENIVEAPELFRSCRRLGVFPFFKDYLPSGRSSEGSLNQVSRNELFALYGDLARIDREEFGIERDADLPFAGARACDMGGWGLQVKITGDVNRCAGCNNILGNVLEEPLEVIWERVRPRSGDEAVIKGGCPPRQAFWDRQKKSQ